MNTNNQSMVKKRIILVSGGIDSTIMGTEFEGKKVFIKYGQKYQEEELEVCKKLFKDLNVLNVDLDLGNNIFIPNRNLTLCSLVVTKYNPDEIFLAGLKDDNVEDKNPEAFKKMSDILSEFSGKRIDIIGPYFNETKGNLVARFIKDTQDGVSLLKQTFSCYFPNNGKECLNCPACLRKYVALKSNGIEVPKITKEISLQYLEKLHTYCNDRISRTLIALKPIFGQILAIDLDDTLCWEEQNHENYRFCKPMKSSIEKVNSLDGLKVIFTARLEADREVTENWLKENKVDYQCLIMNKLPFDKLYDDKAFQL